MRKNRNYINISPSFIAHSANKRIKVKLSPVTGRGGP
jgi:hypothetical protein